MYYLILILLISVFAVGGAYYYSNKSKKEPLHENEKAVINENDLKAQQRVVKEIQNFLSYNGDEQDDIF